jgi:hypothetical protein
MSALTATKISDRAKAVALGVGSLVLLWAVLLMAYDSCLSFRRAGGAVGPSIFAFAASGVGLIATLVLPLALLRAALRAWARPLALRRLLVGALEGGFLAYLVCFAQKYETATLSQRCLAALALVLGAACAFSVAPLFPRLAQLANASLLVGALAVESTLPMREFRMVHFALDLLGAVGVLGLAGHLIERVPKAVRIAACAVLALCVGSAPSVVRGSEEVRGLIYSMSTHARVHAIPLRHLLTVEQSKANRLDIVSCKGTFAAGCGGFVASRVSALRGTLKGADILMLTVDSMRWDQSAALPLLQKELGSYVRFERAVSTAPRTSQAFGSMLRGRTLRQTPFALAAKDQKMAKHATETFGSVLHRNGYRAVHAPSHAFLFPYTSIADGFEPLIDESEFDAQKGIRTRSVPLPKTIALTLQAARQTYMPMFAWIHVMETHAPYYWDGGKGPGSLAGQQHAAADADKKLARFVREFRAARGERPLIIAVFGDHGEEFAEHGGTFHGSTIFAEQVRVMFWLAVPGVTSKVIDAPVSIAAVAATLFELVGLERPCTFLVPSLAACIERTEACPTLAVSELVPFGGVYKQDFLAAYTGEKYRMLYDRRQDVVRMFDADNDPYEYFDLASVATEQLTAMKREAGAWDRQFCVEAAPAHTD